MNLTSAPWTRERFRNLFAERNEKGFPEEELLAATQHAGVVPKASLAFKTMEPLTSDLGIFKLVRKGDFVISLRSFEGGLEYSEYQGILSPAYTVLEPSAKVFAGYFKHVLKSRDFVQSLERHKKGIRDGQAVPYATLRDDHLLVPPLDEQQRIAHFLDEQTTRIDALIAEKERLAVAVREYEQAQISQLLAQGISNAAQTVTGNIYVPAAPSHWRVVPFKRALQGMEQGWSPQCDSRPAIGSEWGVLKVGCVNGTRFNPEENKALPTDLTPDLSCVIRQGDVLVSRANTRELVGSAAIVWGDFPNLLLCDKLYRLKLASDWVTPEFAVLLLRADTARRQIELGASGASSSMQNISQDVIRELVVALPPLDEQTQIVEMAKAIRVKADDLASHVNEHIGRLREYRASLISAAVTGQLDINTYKEAA